MSDVAPTLSVPPEAAWGPTFDVGRATDAVGHLEQALASPDVPGPQEAALRYDLGRAYEALSDRERALDAFTRVVELDAGFQDAAQRLEALRERAAAGASPSEPEGEAYESFDDLIAQSADEAPAEPAAPVAESYESFDEFMNDEAHEAEAGDASEVSSVVEEPPAEEVPVASSQPHPEPAVEPEAAVEAEAPAEPEPEPQPEKPRRRRKISFF